MQREALKYLYDILAAAEKVQRFIAGSSEDDYLSDELLQSAVERQFEIIGEAMGKLHKIAPGEAERFVDYKKMIAFRNVLIHGYATIDPVIVWGVVESNLNDVLNQAREALSAD
ncbi:HepT-like ribonuclease domain-containing protein [Marinobacter sp. MMG032]|uniref:HepT-like ribonuclease domain-containing protein n=1 Tax=Marinobacter sp. MMG032 TaxID=3158548 RepID=A0AAU7MLE6_9GAMM